MESLNEISKYIGVVCMNMVLSVNWGRSAEGGE